ncbi:hypothetical protein ASE74_02185 [Pedobacter sp. Leaf216]|uniref:tautomerase family protein n=1 Tax=Pedobacter sp. Leaf216 TaxID=1735684 RepID=UPI0006F4722C|nr:tautomerase family protein [Pedobacter sp. Leaf216]KQM74810.1 hypothetical protein ASE74_02185 [Pedobacter sp. Leaf216]
MPLVTVTLTKGKPQQYIEQVSGSINNALLESYMLPPNDLFQRFLQLEPGAFIYDRHYRGGPRSDDFILVEVKSNARRTEEKDAAFKSIVEHLSKSPGVRPEDVMIIFDSHSTAEDYSFGSGISANKN